MPKHNLRQFENFEDIQGNVLHEDAEADWSSKCCFISVFLAVTVRLYYWKKKYFSLALVKKVDVLDWEQSKILRQSLPKASFDHQTRPARPPQEGRELG